MIHYLDVWLNFYIVLVLQSHHTVICFRGWNLIVFEPLLQPMKRQQLKIISAIWCVIRRIIITNHSNNAICACLYLFCNVDWVNCFFVTKFIFLSSIRCIKCFTPLLFIRDHPSCSCKTNCVSNQIPNFL